MTTRPPCTSDAGRGETPGPHSSRRRSAAGVPVPELSRVGARASRRQCSSSPRRLRSGAPESAEADPIDEACQHGLHSLLPLAEGQALKAAAAGFGYLAFAGLST